MNADQQRFLVRYTTRDGNKQILHLEASDRREARTVAMESNAYIRRYPTSVDTILVAA